MKPLKVGLVLDDSLDKVDGVQQYVLAIGSWLSKQGHEVHYLVGQTTRTDVEHIHSLSRNLAVRFNGNRMSMPLAASKQKIVALLAAEQFDVLHVQMPYSPLLAHRIIRAASAKTAVIGTFHVAPNSPLMTAGTRVLGGWLRQSLRRFDAIASVSPAAQQFARQTFGISSTVIPNAVPVTQFAGAKPFKKQDDRLTIMFLGRWVPRKGCLYLLQAINALVQKYPEVPPFRVRLCGKGPLEESLRAYAREHNLESYVEFVGFVSEEDKPRYYASADIVVFPSTGGESFGIVLVEAMASGRAAVLGGNNPGYISVLGERPELLFDPRDSAALADKLHYYLTDAAARHMAAAWGKEQAKQYDEAVVGGQIIDLYVQALRKRQDLA